MTQWKPQGLKVNVRQDQAVSVHDPQAKCQLEDKEESWRKFDESLESVSRAERLVTGGDFSGHVGRGNRGDKYICIKERHAEGQMVDFAKRTEMAVVTM